MDNFEGESRRETSRDDGRQGVGRGHRVWDGLPQNNTALRRPHCASTGNQPSAEPISPITAEHNLKEKKFRLVPLSPQAAEFVPRSYKLPQTSLSQPPVSESNAFPTRQLIHQHTKSSIQDRLRRARETPPNVCVPSSYLRKSDDLMDDNALEEALQLQCNIEDSDMGNYDKYTDDQCTLNENKKKEEEQNKEEEAYNFQICQRLNDIINILIVNPAEFTNLIPPFVNKLRWDRMRCLQAIVTTIIESSIAESNFRYSGARFCKYLDNTLEDCKELFMFSKELFRDLLYFQCRLETRFEEAEWQKQSEEERDQKKCNGLILFLAELVAQMDESYAFTLGELLVWFITKVLQRPASNSVKYICQALKLAGQKLEKDKSMSKDMENMMRALTELVNNGQVDTHVGNMVNSVHELRKDWGRRVSNCDLSGTSNALSNKVHQQSDQLGASNYNSSGTNTAPLREIQLDQPVMYGPDGEILSAEESKFLQDNVKLDFDQQPSDEEYEDDNYDDEIATAYEEFLKDKSK
ncbi:polyadenylate-binding protein-interacting protein 1 [Formica exsecta]|uniref:polyadenylate-binding protein-interacting protein 1 n=1 Tax=Formica exsecta TaxID=72781 RepID=UPI001142D401|nr:polyadenylate-binding protein-interacting protein 1 [Formica exsecta]